MSCLGRRFRSELLASVFLAEELVEKFLDALHHSLSHHEGGNGCVVSYLGALLANMCQKMLPVGN